MPEKIGHTTPDPIPDFDSLPPAAFKIFSRRQSISNLMLQLAATADETVTVRRLLTTFGERAFGALMIVFAIPIVFPMPPGVSLVLGAPLLAITIQIMIGRPRLWLPRVLMDRGMSRAAFIAVSLKALPVLRRIEVWLKPRHQGILGAVGERLLGAMATLLALIIFLPLPIPFGNMIPAAALVAFGFGMVEFDGLAAALGWLLAAASLSVIVLLSGSIVQALFALMAMLPG